MFSTRLVEHKKEREKCLLSFLPVGEYFFLVHQLKPGRSEPLECLLGPFQKIAFRTKYGECNAMNVANSEIMSFREKEVMVIRVICNQTMELEETRLGDHPKGNGSVDDTLKDICV